MIWKADVVIDFVLLILYLLIGGISVILYGIKSSKDRYIQVRGAKIAIVSGVMNIIMAATILTKEIYERSDVDSEGNSNRRFSCATILWVSHLYPPLYALPYVLRSYRLIVLFTPDVLKKHGNWVKDRYLVKILLGFVAAHSVVAAMVMVIEEKYRCLQFRALLSPLHL